MDPPRGASRAATPTGPVRQTRCQEFVKETVRPSRLARAGARVHLIRNLPVVPLDVSPPRAVRVAKYRRARTLASTFIGVLVAGGCTKSASPGVQQQGQGVPPPAQVGVVTVTPANIAEPYELGAQVQPYRRVEARARVEGIIVDRPFTEGAVVS